MNSLMVIIPRKPVIVHNIYIYIYITTKSCTDSFIMQEVVYN